MFSRQALTRDRGKKSSGTSLPLLECFATPYQLTACTLCSSSSCGIISAGFWEVYVFLLPGMAADISCRQSCNRLVSVGNKIAAAAVAAGKFSNPLSTNRTNVQARVNASSVLLLLAGTVQGINGRL